MTTGGFRPVPADTVGITTDTTLSPVEPAPFRAHNPSTPSGTFMCPAPSNALASLHEACSGVMEHPLGDGAGLGVAGGFTGSSFDYLSDYDCMMNSIRVF